MEIIIKMSGRRCMYKKREYEMKQCPFCGEVVIVRKKKTISWDDGSHCVHWNGSSFEIHLRPKRGWKGG